MVEYLKIVYVRGQQVLDGRGNPALEAAVTVRNCVNGELTQGRAIVPDGTGQRERLCVEEMKTAAQNVEKYLQEPLAGTEVTDQRRIDHILREMERRGEKAGPGADVLAAVSLACADAGAKALHTPLYRYLGGVQGQQMPVPMMTVIDGGTHASNSLDVQEFMVVPVGAGSLSEGIEWGCEVYHTLKEILSARGLATSVGDEGGFAPNLSTEIEAIDFIMEAVHGAGFTPGKDVCISLDVAAGNWKGKGGSDYCMPKQKRCYSSRELMQEWEELVEKYPVFSLEDPLGTEDWNGWQELTKRLGKKTLLVGDALFQADVERLKRGSTMNAANAILIRTGKPGTLSETMDVVHLAGELGYRTILSQTGGESEDSFLADLSVAFNTGLIKTGAPGRGERTAKYNQLLRIEEELYGGRTDAREDPDCCGNPVK
ncbi:MAG: phosphopyruvate hydratase [Lachnospiraceae bacterium]|nr:phosphopyruvate hydratase [Lachnospiraceae bacterium]